MNNFISNVTVNTQGFQQGQLPDDEFQQPMPEQLSNINLPRNYNQTSTKNSQAVNHFHQIDAPSVDQMSSSSIIFETVTDRDQQQADKKKKKIAKSHQSKKKQRHEKQKKNVKVDKNQWKKNPQISSNVQRESINQPSTGNNKMAPPMFNPFYPPPQGYPQPFMYPPMGLPGMQAPGMQVPHMYPNYPMFPHNPAVNQYPYMVNPNLKPQMQMFPPPPPPPHKPQNAVKTTRQQEIYTPKSYTQSQVKAGKAQNEIKSKVQRQNIQQVKKSVTQLSQIFEPEEKEEILTVLRSLINKNPKTQEGQTVLVIFNFEENFLKLEKKIDQIDKQIKDSNTLDQQNHAKTKKQNLMNIIEQLQLKHVVSKLKEKKISKKLISQKQQSQMKKLLNLLVRDPRKMIK